MFLAVQGAALTRVFGPLLWPAGYGAWLLLSGGLWSLAFGLIAIRYWPILTRPRADQPAAAGVPITPRG